MKDNNYEKFTSFGEALTELMTVREISPKQLAEAFSVNLDTIYSWKRNDTTPSLSKLLVISDYFELPLDYLSGRSNLDKPFYNKICPPFSKRLREVMKEKGVSTYYLRKHTRFGSSFFTKWDRGADPLITTVTELADILDCTIDYLVGRDR